MAQNFLSGVSPTAIDTQRVLEVKILNRLNLMSGGGSGGAGASGAGSPEGVVTAGVATVYWDTAGQSLWIKNSGSGAVGWVQVVA